MESQAIEPGLQSLNNFNWGYRAAAVLHTANKLDIFTILSEDQMSIEQICRKIKSQTEMTEKLLIACTAMGLLEKHEGQYKNTDLSQKYLVKGQELYQGDIIAHSATLWDFWGALTHQVISGKEPAGIKPSDHKNFIMGMHNNASAGRAKMFTDKIDLTGRRRLFDVGGGPGTYSIAACRCYPELAAVVFDLPETIGITKRLIEQEQMRDRISTKEGDWNTDSFGRDNDVVLLSNVLHGPASGGEMKLGKAHASMASGGLLVIQDFLLNNSKTGPLICALFNIMVGAYSKAELISLIEAAGFGSIKIAAVSDQLGCTWVTAEK